MSADFLVPLLAAAIQSGTPILYATLGEIITERSGVLNLGVEGIMLFGALAAFSAAKITGSPTIGFLVGGFFGALLAGVHGMVCLGFQGNQVVSGLALTILGVGLANYLGTPYVGQSAPGFKPLALPFLSKIPLLGPILFNHDPLVYLAYFVPPIL
jgi:simple sugar transport system permease protein